MSEYKPTEYVVDFGDCRSSAFVELNMALIEQNGAKLGEPIVRCRDCIYYDDYLGSCVRGNAHQVRAAEPDGFCAWGERKKND